MLESNLNDNQRADKPITHQWRSVGGNITHDGDCYVWGRSICTCGLLHHLAPMGEAERNKVFPDFNNEYGQHVNVLDKIWRDR